MHQTNQSLLLFFQINLKKLEKILKNPSSYIEISICPIKNIINVINIHMKCCDSGLERRKKASKMLHEYIYNNEKLNDNWIVLGDWNDDLKDEVGEHCFKPFLDNQNFKFVTDSIVYDYDQASYPKAPYHSFLDHILISTNLINDNDYQIRTVPIDKMMGGYDIYEYYISDHLPVLLQIPDNIH